jgi:hypothetical protein
MTDMNFIDPIKSAEALRAGQDLVEADKDLHGVADVRAVAQHSHMDNAGGLSFLGLRNMAHRAAERYLGAEGVAKMDEALKAVVKARAAGGEGRLDDASLSITSDRIDSANPSATIALARELEYIYSEVMREEGPILSARKLFGSDRRVPAGAKSYTVRRIEGSGEAKFYRAGMEVPLVGIGRDEETAFIKHAVIGMEMDFFSQASDAFAGIAEAAEKMREMREAMAEFDEQLAWNGSVAHKINGILNYPWLRKRLIATTFTSVTTAAAFQTLLDGLNDMVNEVLDRNPGMAASLRFITAPGFHRLMAQTRHPDNFRTLKEVFLAGQPNISAIEEAPHLQARGPGGEDGVLIVPKGSKGPQIVSPVGFTMMPVQTTNYGFTRSQAAYQSFGGVRMPDVLRSALIWAPADY